MNNLTPESTQSQYPLAPLETGTALGFCLAGAALSFLAGSGVLTLTFTSFAAAFLCVVMLACKHPALIIPFQAASLVAISLTRGSDFICGTLYAAFPVLLAAALYLAVSRKKPAFTAVGICTAVLALCGAGMILFELYRSYSSIPDGLTTVFGEIKNNVETAIRQMTEAAKQIAQNSENEIVVTENDISGYVRSILIILPGCALALLEVVAAASYFMCHLLLRAKGRIKALFPNGLDFSVSSPSAIFFMLCGVIALLFSTSENIMFISYAALNVCIIFLIPMFVRGLAALIEGFKRPTLPDGTVIPNAIKLSGLLPAIFLIILLFIDPVLSVLFLAYYGAFGIIRKALAKKLKDKADRGE